MTQQHPILMTDFRALCAELLEIIDLLCEGDARPDCDIVARARAFLAQPEPEEPTDEEIMELMPQQMHEDLAAAARAMAEQTGVDSIRVKGVMRIILNRHSVDLARAVLARWGK